MPSGIGTSNVPLGPCTFNWSPICIFTVAGTGIGFFPTLDICRLPGSLPNPAQNLAADAFLARCAACHHTSRRGQDADAEAALHPRNICLANIGPATGARYALDPGDNRRIVRRIFQVDADDLLQAFVGAGLMSTLGRGDLEVGDIAFFLEYPGDLGFQFRSRYVHFRMARRHGIAHPSQHICDWITCHLSRPPFLPTGLHNAWNFTVQRQLPEAQAADSVFAQECPRTAAAPAAIAVPACELRLLLLLVRKLVRVRLLAGFCDLGGCCHEMLVPPAATGLLLLSSERHSHLLEQRQTFGVRSGSGGYGYVHPLGLVDLRIIDFGENQLIFNAQRIIAASVERFR